MGRTRYRHGVNMFNKKGYEVRKQVLDISTLDLMYEYYKLKVENNQFEVDDYQVPGTITMYGDTLNDSLLRWTLPFAQEVIGEELYPCYSFLRIYNGGDTLQPHCDRPSCEFSATLPIHFDKKWPIFMKPHDFEKYEEDFSKSKQDSIEIDGSCKSDTVSLSLDRGDICFYEGTKMNHWREPYKGNECVQLFIHYVRKDGEYSDFKYDKRKNLGLETTEKNTILDARKKYLESFFDD